MSVQVHRYQLTELSCKNRCMFLVLITFVDIKCICRPSEVYIQSIVWTIGLKQTGCISGSRFFPATSVFGVELVISIFYYCFRGLNHGLEGFPGLLTVIICAICGKTFTRVAMDSLHFFSADLQGFFLAVGFCFGHVVPFKLRYPHSTIQDSRE
jgi:hypothetical protein